VCKEINPIPFSHISILDPHFKVTVSGKGISKQRFCFNQLNILRILKNDNFGTRQHQALLKDLDYSRIPHVTLSLITNIHNALITFYPSFQLASRNICSH
jgi:hypothetical protein